MKWPRYPISGKQGVSFTLSIGYDVGLQTCTASPPRLRNHLWHELHFAALRGVHMHTHTCINTHTHTHTHTQTCGFDYALFAPSFTGIGGTNTTGNYIYISKQTIQSCHVQYSILHVFDGPGEMYISLNDQDWKYPFR